MRKKKKGKKTLNPSPGIAPGGSPRGVWGERWEGGPTHGLFVDVHVFIALEKIGGREGEDLENDVVRMRCVVFAA